MLTVAAFYRFTPFTDPAALKGPLEAACRASDVRGTILLAPEGINGAVAGAPDRVAAALAHVRALPGCGDLACRESSARAQPFLRLKVRLKKEIVTLGRPGVDPAARVGARVAPADWDALIARADVAVIDTRNTYETGIGKFPGAIDPQTDSFTDFPLWWAQNADRLRGKTIAMYCTGGIRCEKATSWLLGQGLDEVFHLDGGILRYLEEIPAAESRWEGECFVFDGRVAVGPGLQPGAHVLCHACRRPVAPADQASPSYRPGISCPACADERSDADRARFAERQRQIRFARARGESHLGRRE